MVFTTYKGVYSEGVFYTYEDISMCLLVYMRVFSYTCKVFTCKVFTIHESVSKLVRVFTIHTSVFQCI